MLPDDPKGRADCDRWLYWQAFHLINTVIAKRAKSKTAEKDIELNIGVLNGQLEGPGIRPRRIVHSSISPSPRICSAATDRRSTTVRSPTCAPGWTAATGSTASWRRYSDRKGSDGHG